MKKKYPIFENLRKTFFNRKKIRLQLSKSGVFWLKKTFRKSLETSVIISLYDGHSRYFDKKFQILFQVDKNPTSSFKIGGILAKKNVPEIS